MGGFQIWWQELKDTFRQPQSVTPQLLHLPKNDMPYLLMTSILFGILGQPLQAVSTAKAGCLEAAGSGDRIFRLLQPSNCFYFNFVLGHDQCSSARSRVQGTRCCHRSLVSLESSVSRDPFELDCLSSSQLIYCILKFLD